MKKSKNGVTLIELLVVIAIIAILVIGMSNINFNRATDKEYLNAFNNRVSSIIEKNRNNALIWKSMSSALIVPETYSIRITTSGSGTLWVSYISEWNVHNIMEDTLRLNPFESISNLTCFLPNSTNTGSSANVDILIAKNTLSLSGCTIWSFPSISWSILEIETSYKNLSKKIILNTLTGKIEKK